MGARRFFVEDAHAVGDLVAIAGSDAHKIRHVLRLRSGDRVEVVDSAAQVFEARLEIGEDAVRAVLASCSAVAAPQLVTIDVAQGIPKGAKMDFVVEKLTELGAAAILPLASERTIVRDPGESKLERWRRLAQAAAAQSGRSGVTRIEPPLGFDELLARFAQYDLVLFPWEVATAEPLRERLPALLEGARRVLLVIGPEGGFSHDEAERAANAGAALLSLGPRILRTETAGLALLSVVQYLII